MAGKARSTERTGQPTAGSETQTLTDDVRPSQPAEGAAEGPRSATLNLPFVTAQFRAPDVRLPNRDDLAGAARGVQSLMPSRGAALFYGGLALTALAGAIEWPVAAAIGVGTALASRRAADPTPRGGTPSLPVQAETRAGDTGGAATPGTAT